MSLYQISLPSTIPSSSGQPSSPTSIPTTVSIAHTRLLCLNSALAGLEIHLSVPPSQLYHLPLPFYAMTGHILTTLTRLRGCASSTDKDDPLRFDLAGILERNAAHLEKAEGAVRGAVRDARGRNDRLTHWAGWLRRCARALGVAEGDGQNLRGFVAGMEPFGKGAGIGRTERSTAGEGGKELDGVAGEGVGVDGYMTPSSGLYGGGVPVGEAGEAMGGQDRNSLPMEWTTALLEDISGYGLFGLSDDFLMQDMFTGGIGGDIGLPDRTQ